MEQEYKPKPIDKEYLKNTLKDFDSEVLSKKYLQSNDEQLHTHDNKETLDKLSTSNDGKLLFDGNELNSSSATAGKSAYEIAVQNGFEGTEQQWLESLKANQVDAYTKEESNNKFVTAPQIWTGSNQFKFGVDADGNYGYIKAGADTVTPFKSGNNISSHILLNTSNNIIVPVSKDLYASKGTVCELIINRSDFFLIGGTNNTPVSKVELPIGFVGSMFWTSSISYRPYTTIIAEITNESDLEAQQTSNVTITNEPYIKGNSGASYGILSSLCSTASPPIMTVTFPSIDFTHDIHISIKLYAQTQGSVTISNSPYLDNLYFIVYKPKVIY